MSKLHFHFYLQKNRILSSEYVAMYTCFSVPQPSIRTMVTDWDEEELARRANMHDGP